MSESAPAPSGSIHDESAVVNSAHAAFVKFDADRSGTIDTDELRAALEEAGLVCSEQESGFVLRRYRREGSAALTLEEFTDVVRDVRSQMLKSMLEDRLSLRTQPDVQVALDAWWTAAASALKGPSAGQASARLHRTQYAAVLKKVIKAMTEDYDEARAIQVAQAEAKADCQGRDFLNTEQFKDGMCVHAASQEACERMATTELFRNLCLPTARPSCH